MSEFPTNHSTRRNKRQNTTKKMNFKLLLKIVNEEKKLHPQWRYGQALFNTLNTYYPFFAERIRGTYIDPYHIKGNKNTKKIKKIKKILKKLWNKR
jgi:hypothetical protein